MLDFSLSNLSPELRLLLTGALYPLQEAEVERLQAGCSPDIDWAAFLALVERHHLVPTLYRNLSLHAAGLVPESALKVLQERAGALRQRSLQLLAALGQIAQRFAQSGIPVCSLKGPLLAQRLFGDLSLRSSTDLDLLVHPDHLDQAEALLLAHGCQRVFPAVPLTPLQRHAFQQEWYNYTYLLPSPRIYIELHWTIAFPDLVSFDVTLQMQDRLRPASIASGLYTLYESDLPVYLLVHGSKHNWVRLKWLVDFAAWLRAAQEGDWLTLDGRVKALGLQRSLGQGARLAFDLLGVAPPGGLPLPGAGAASIAKLVQSSLVAIRDVDYRGVQPGGLQRLKSRLYITRLKPGWRYKWSVFSKLWVLPYDWQELPLPDWLFPLYGLLRPFLWLRRAILRRFAKRAI